MSKYIFIVFLSSILMGQDDVEKKNVSIPASLSDEMTDLELMLVADINTNNTLSEFLKLDVVSNSLKLNAPKYDRFERKNNKGFYLPTGRATTLYLDRGIVGWSEASKWLIENNESYSSGFFNTSFEKFSYYNSRKGYIDVDNYFKDAWDQRDINDYIRYMHAPSYRPDTEQNTIYDPNRTK